MKFFVQLIFFFVFSLSATSHAESDSCFIDKGILQTNPPKAEYVIMCGGFLVLSFESTHLDPNFAEIQSFMKAFGYEKLSLLSFNSETGAAKILAEK